LKAWKDRLTLPFGNSVQVIPSENLYLYISLLTKPSGSEKMDRSIIVGDMAVQEDVTGNNASDFNYITSLSPVPIPSYCAETTWIMNVVSN